MDIPQASQKTTTPAPDQTSTSTPATTPASLNFGQFRIPQTSAGGFATKKVLTTVPVQKPAKEVFFRTHPDEQYWFQTGVIELKTEGETYLVHPDLWDTLQEEATFVRKVLVTSITKHGSVFLWPIRLPGEDGQLDGYNASAHEVAQVAKSQWVRMWASRQSGSYEHLVAPLQGGEPQWPSASIDELLKKAFAGKIITKWDHPVLRRLRGEI